MDDSRDERASTGWGIRLGLLLAASALPVGLWARIAPRSFYEDFLAAGRHCLDRRSGVTEQQLRDLSNYEASEALTPREKLVLSYATEMTRTPAFIPKDLFGALRERFDEASFVELPAAVALENYRARFDRAFGIGSQDFSGGTYCTVPETPARSVQEVER